MISFEKDFLENKPNVQESMKKGSFMRSSNVGSWLILAITIAILFLCYIGFSLHEERSYIKFKLLQNARKSAFASSKNLPQRNEKNKDMIVNLTMIRSSEDLDLYHIGYKMHAFNDLVSERIGYQARNLPDTRPSRCRNIEYEVQAQVSVIICFYNEALSTLLRTITSVFKRTSPKILKEIIVVDDGSMQTLTKTSNLDSIESYVKSNYLKMKLHTLRSEKQLGLIRARMFGARHASGDTLVFLDSHCEVNEGWIEPLLYDLINHTLRVVSPVVDTIHPDTFQYEASSVVRGGFNWGLHFSWEGLPSYIKDPSKAYRTPTISGGLFAATREGFFKLGGYDEQMDEWGGENLELSFRTWMCGGSVYIEPCSRVGHVFRRRRPYGQGSTASIKNSVRLAHVWLDEFKVHFFNVRPEAKSVKYGDLVERYELKTNLNCKSFKWYLNNVYPEVEIPNERPSKVVYNIDRSLKKVITRGTISVTGLDICLNAETDTKPVLWAGSCRTSKNNTVWIFNDFGEIIARGTKWCLEASSSTIRLSKCESIMGLQSWTFLSSNGGVTKQSTGKVFNMAAGQCMSVNQISETTEAVLRICTDPSVQFFVINSVQ